MAPHTLCHVQRKINFYSLRLPWLRPAPNAFSRIEARKATAQTAEFDKLIHYYRCRHGKSQSKTHFSHGNQLLQLDPELKPSPLGDRFPPHRGKMSHSDKRGSRWRVAPDEGYLGQNAAILHPHQSPSVTASPDWGKPLFGKLILCLFSSQPCSGGCDMISWMRCKNSGG